jgi:hypothetical protein
MKAYNITQADFLEAQKLNVQLKFIIFPIVLPFVIIALILGDNLFSEIGVLAMAATLVALLSASFSIKKKIIKAFQGHKALHETTTMSFDHKTIKWEAESGSFKLRFSDLKKFKIGKNVTLIFESKQRMRIIPHRAFETPKELAELHDALNKNC